MNIVKFILLFILSVNIGACASMPKPAQTPEDKANDVFANQGVVYLELCELECELPGLFGEDVGHARKAKIEKLAELIKTRREDISAYEAANDFANRFNRAMLVHSREPKK